MHRLVGVVASGGDQAAATGEQHGGQQEDERRLGVRPGSGVRALVAAVDRAFRELLSAVDTALDAAAARMGINRTDLRCLEVLDREVFLPLVFDGMRLLDGCSTRSCDVLQIAVPR